MAPAKLLLMKPTLKNLFPNGNKTMKNTLIGLILGLIIALWAFYIYTQRPVNITKTTEKGGAIATAAPENLPTTIPDELQIETALAKKYNLTIEDTSLIIKEINPTQAAGTVSFAGEGGWFLAYKDNEVWKIVADGNGTVTCEVVAPYHFPTTMVPECVDKNGTLKKL